MQSKMYKIWIGSNFPIVNKNITRIGILEKIQIGVVFTFGRRQ